jgi:hypothetical protein
MFSQSRNAFVSSGDFISEAEIQSKVRCVFSGRFTNLLLTMMGIVWCFTVLRALTEKEEHSEESARKLCGMRNKLS